MEWILGYIAFSIIFGGLLYMFADFGIFYNKANMLGKIVLFPIVVMGLCGFIITKIVLMFMNKSENIDTWWDRHCTKK